MKSKLGRCFLFVLTLTGSSLVAHAQALELPQASPPATLKQRVGLTDIEIVYSRPGVKGRKIFGELEPWKAVWRAGANQATKITFSTPVTFGGTPIAAGSYALFAIPDQTEWTVILATAGDKAWGAYSYDPKDDVARVTVKPIALSQPVETFTIDVNDLRDESATLNLIWERTRVPVPLAVSVVKDLVPKIEALMSSSAEKKPYAQVANFYLEHKLDLKKALRWMDEGIAQQPEAFYLIQRKARIQAALGDKAGALATAEKSLAMARKAGGALGAEYVRLNEALIASLK